MIRKRIKNMYKIVILRSVLVLVMVLISGSAVLAQVALTDILKANSANKIVLEQLRGGHFQSIMYDCIRLETSSKRLHPLNPGRTDAPIKILE